MDTRWLRTSGGHESWAACRAMASEIQAEWGLARTLADFWVWLGRDAPSEDRV